VVDLRCCRCCSRVVSCSSGSSSSLFSRALCCREAGFVVCPVRLLAAFPTPPQFDGQQLFQQLTVELRRHSFDVFDQIRPLTVVTPGRIELIAQRVESGVRRQNSGRLGRRFGATAVFLDAFLECLTEIREPRTDFGSTQRTVRVLSGLELTDGQLQNPVDALWQAREATQILLNRDWVFCPPAVLLVDVEDTEELFWSGVEVPGDETKNVWCGRTCPPESFVFRDDVHAQRNPQSGRVIRRSP
jgi:hypothetical protein